MKNWTESDATSIIIRCGGQVNGKIIRVKAAHGPRVWAAVAFLTGEFRYQLDVVPGGEFMPLPESAKRVDGYGWRDR